MSIEKKSVQRCGVAVLILMCSFVMTVAAQTVPARDAGTSLRELKATVEAFAGKLPRDERFGPGPLADATLAIRKTDLLRRSPFGGARLDEALRNTERAVAGLGRAHEGDAPRRGFQERAYISAVDGSAEPYFLYVPTSYDEKVSYPLIVFLHGYYSTLNVGNWFDLMYSPTLQDVCEREGAILLMPYGRSNTEFMGIGESDVLQAMDYVRDEYNVDPRRIILSGASMGGSGAYTIACHYPDLFAGVMAITGRVDYYKWMEIAKESLPRFKQVQVDTDYARELLPNLAHVPLLIFHGEHDQTLDIGQSRLMRDLLQNMGYQCEYVELEGLGHQATWTTSFRHPKFMELLKTARKPEPVTRVTFRTFTLKYPSAYWVTIDEIEQWGSVATVNASVVGDNEINIETENISALTLGPGIPKLSDLRKVRVKVNGQRVTPIVGAPGVLGIRLAASGDATGLRKTHELSGPIREAYDGPFAIVYPAADTPENRADRENAVQIAREWLAYVQVVPRIYPDSAICEEEIRDYNLILCGSPATHTLLARIADKLPVRIEAESYVVGNRAFPRQNKGLRFVYPNPLNSRRYLLVVHGATWAPRVQSNHKLDMLPDFIVYSDETEEDGTWFPTNRFLCAGFFDGNWRLSPETTWLNAKPSEYRTLADRP